MDIPAVRKADFRRAGPERDGRTRTSVLRTMKRFVYLIAFIFITCPVSAQDVDLGLGGDASSLLNLPAPRGNTPARGAAPSPRGSNAPNAVDRLARLRELLAGTNNPLNKEQEAALGAFLTAEIPGMRRTLQARIAELQKGREPGAAPR